MLLRVCSVNWAFSICVHVFVSVCLSVYVFVIWNSQLKLMIHILLYSYHYHHLHQYHEQHYLIYIYYWWTMTEIHTYTQIQKKERKTTSVLPGLCPLASADTKISENSTGFSMSSAIPLTSLTNCIIVNTSPCRIVSSVPNKIID